MYECVIFCIFMYVSNKEGMVSSRARVGLHPAVDDASNAPASRRSDD